MKRVEHVGTVVAIDGAKALVQLKPDESCGAGFRCACCVSVRSQGRQMEVDGAGLEEGDFVCISVPVYTAYLSTLVIFVLPIVLLIAGGAVGWLVEGRTVAHDMSIIIGMACGFTLAVLVAIIVNRRMAAGGGIEVRRLKRTEP